MFDLPGKQKTNVTTTRHSIPRGNFLLARPTFQGCLRENCRQLLPVPPGTDYRCANTVITSGIQDRRRHQIQTNVNRNTCPHTTRDCRVVVPGSINKLYENRTKLSEGTKKNYHLLYRRRRHFTRSATALFRRLSAHRVMRTMAKTASDFSTFF